MSYEITVEGGTSVRLPTAGKYCDRDIVVTATGGVAEPVIEPLEITENGTYTAPDGVDGYSPVTVNVPTGGSSGTIPASSTPVNFYDYDGTLLHSYTVAEVQSLSELPPLPTHPGLICQGWNWSLESIKSHNRAVNVGAKYTTDDGTTRLYITLHEGRTSPMLGVCPKGTVTVDWGDGTTPDVLTGTSISTLKWTPNHEYTAPGDYVIRLTVDGEMSIYGNTSYSVSAIVQYNNSDNRKYAYLNALQRIEIGDNVISIGNSAFRHCYSLTSITIPDGVTSIGSNAFQNCYSLAFITIPDGVASIGARAFQTCYSLTSITIPDSVTSIISGAFQYCYSLTSITIPDGVTSIESNAFNGCYSLGSITIPDGVTSIGNYIFSDCYSLASITIPDGVTSIGAYTFQNCYSLGSITIPDGVTSIGNYTFQNCYSLGSITIPDGVTRIGNYVFKNCYSLTSITIPDGVTSIGNNAFQNCYSARHYDFTKHTAVPTLYATTAFNAIPADCEIRVPAALYDKWIAATNWSTYAANIVGI